MKRNIYRFLNDENGNVLVLVATAMITLLGLTALVIDGGRLYVEKSVLQKAADAAALAGVQELPLRITMAKNVATNIALKNNAAVKTVEIPSDAKSIKVTTASNVELTFGKIFGIMSVPVTASAKVELRPITSAIGVIPIGLDYGDYSKWKNCTEIILKIPEPNDPPYPTNECVGNNNLGSGNTGVLAFSGTGADTFGKDLEFGVQKEVKVGDKVNNETGAMAGKTREAINKRVAQCKYIYTYDAEKFITNPPPPNCAQVVTVPLYKIININNQVKEVEIVGFATMFILKNIEQNEKTLKARLMSIQMDRPSSSDQADYGTYWYKLIE